MDTYYIKYNTKLIYKLIDIEILRKIEVPQIESCDVLPRPKQAVVQMKNCRKFF